MQGVLWPAEAGNLIQEHDRRALPEDLRRAARGEAALDEAFETLAHYQEELARIATDVLERETWVLTAIIIRSGPIWDHLRCPTLRFVPDRPDEPYLELGIFSHLAGLAAPSADEQALIADPAPRWARVSPHHERRLAGGTGALACSYVPVSVAEAVATLGLGRILAQIEAATRTTGQALLAQAQNQRERQARLLGVERMLGWEPDPTEASLDRTTTARTHLLLLVLGQGGPAWWALGAALVGLVVILVCLL